MPAGTYSGNLRRLEICKQGVTCVASLAVMALTCCAAWGQAPGGLSSRFAPVNAYSGRPTGVQPATYPPGPQQPQPQSGFRPPPPRVNQSRYATPPTVASGSGRRQPSPPHRAPANGVQPAYYPAPRNNVRGPQYRPPQQAPPGAVQPARFQSNPVSVPSTNHQEVVHSSAPPVDTKAQPPFFRSERLGFQPPGFPRIQPPVHKEVHQLSVRPPQALGPTEIPDVPAPPTIGLPGAQRQIYSLSLDHAIRVALVHSDVVRIVVGDQATSTGRTIFDPAIRATQIDRERARFDPNANISNTWTKAENPFGVLSLTPNLAQITGVSIDQYALNAGISKANIFGGVASLDVTASNTAIPGLLVPPLPIFPPPLNPEKRSSVQFSFTQPLFQGAGREANLAPVVAAQVGTEISYYEFKESVQELVRSVVEAYWQVVFARIDLWVRQQQVAESHFAYERAQSRQRRGMADAAEVAQTRAAMSSFKVAVVKAKGELLKREALLRNVIGIPPADPMELVPVTPMKQTETKVEWDRLAAMASLQRPDIIQKKLAIEAAEQLLIVAKNQARTQVDLVGGYRMNDLSGRTPSGANIGTNAGQFADWSLGVNMTVPFGQRLDRANLRQQELSLAREKALLNQEIHEALHSLADSYRQVDQFFAEYLAARDAREAARINLDQNLAEYKQGRVIYLYVLQAITNWGEAVTAEAAALASYNASLARLDREAGAILDVHGVQLVGENYFSRGPLAPLNGGGNSYPYSTKPSENIERYPAGTRPTEEAYRLSEQERGRRSAPRPMRQRP